MSDTWSDAKQEYENENSSSTIITNPSNNDLLTPPTISDANSLIKLVNVNGINELYIIQANALGEIRFLTANAKNYNNQNGLLLYNTKIGEDGKLYFFHSYTILNIGKLSGWYDIGDNINSIEITNAIQDALIGGLTISVGTILNDISLIQTDLAGVNIVQELQTLQLEETFIRLRVLEARTGFDDYDTDEITEELINTALGEFYEIAENHIPNSVWTYAQQRARMSWSGKISNILYKVLTDTATGLAILGFGTAIVAGIRALIDGSKEDEYKKEIINITNALNLRAISNDLTTLNHTGLTIVSGNTGFATPNTKYSVEIQKDTILLISINATPTASVELVERVGLTDFTIGETISIPKSSLGGGTGGNLVLSVASLGTFQAWANYRTTYLLSKTDGIQVKNRRKQGVIGADDIDTGQFTTTNVSYTDTTDTSAETITYKQLKSRLNLLPTGASDVDVYTSTGKIGVGTTPETPLHTYNDTNNILRIATAVNGEASLEFKRGTDIDGYTDWRFKSATGNFKLQYEDDEIGYGDTGSEIFSTNTTLLTISKDTQINANVGVGITPSTTLHTYHATDNILRLATGTGATDKTQIQFVKGTTTDVNADFRLVSELAFFKLQYSTNTLAFGDTGTDLISARATTITLHKNTTLSDKVGIGGVSSHSTYKVNVGGDVNISAGSSYRINGAVLSYNNLANRLTAGANITIDAFNEISAQVPNANNILSNITSGTLAIDYGGTGTNDILAGNIVFGNATADAYTYSSFLKYDATMGRLAVGLPTPAYTIDSGGDINIPLTSNYRIGGSPLSYNNLADKLTAGTNITITSGVIDAIVPAQLTAGAGITINSGIIYADTQLFAGTNIDITSGVISANVPAQLTAGTGITITSGAINATTQLTAGTNIDITSGVISANVPAQLTAGTNITITSGAINAIVPAQLTAGTNITITSGAINASVPTTFNASAITAGTLPVSRGGTGIGVVSVGVIPFGNAGSTAYDWRVLLNWDNTNFRLGVNKTSPAYTIDSGGDINIPTGSVYRINGNALTLDNLSGTLSLSKGGTGGTSIGNGAIPIGNALQTAYTWTNLFKYDITNGRLSLGVATPLYTLDVAGGVNISTGNSYRIAGNPISFANIAGTLGVNQGGTGLTTITAGNILYGNDASAIANSTSLKYVSGRLGINMSGTPLANLHIGTGTLATGGTFYVWFDYFSGSSLGFTNTNRFDVCAYLQGSLWLAGGRFLASSSDVRIKKEIEDINDDSALNMILAVEPKTYKYIDKPTLGDKRVYGFIAQQIREVIPEAINLQKERIPNVMLLATYNNNIITLPSQPVSVVIKVGDTIKCYDKDNKEIIAFVDEVIDTLTFRIKELEEPYTDTKIFIYGTEIDDFHTIDKNYIYTLNVCATQELHRKIVSQEQRIRQLEEKVERLLNYLS